MKTNLEIEYKTLITEEEFNRIIKAYPFSSTLQKNSYYNSCVTDLHRLGFAIRIREIDNTYLFTMKEKSELGNMEYEVELDEDSVDALYSDKLKDLFKEKKIEGPFTKIGELRTFRTEVKFNYGLLCIDENHYNDKVDYEIEYEINNDEPENAQQEFQDLLKRFNITYTQALPKRVRAIQNMEV